MLDRRIFGIMNELELFYTKFYKKFYKKGDVIFIQGEEPQYAYAIKSGVVRVYTTTLEYEERSISFVTKDEVFPICWLFAKTKTVLFFYVAHTDCELYVIDRTSFHRYLKSSGTLSHTLLEHTINDYVGKALQITALEQVKASSKVLHTLNSFTLRYGKKLLDDLIRINIPLTQKDIASFAALARETVAIELLQLRKKGVITIKNKFYTVNVPKLKKMIEDVPENFIKISD
jgi:CRP/FNR family cyclic AMP-dependent transcriptional regulator